MAFFLLLYITKIDGGGKNLFSGRREKECDDHGSDGAGEREG